MRTIEEINKIYNMLTSSDIELQNLGLSIIYQSDRGIYFSGRRRWKIQNAITELAAEAYTLGQEAGVAWIEERYKIRTL